VAELQEQFAAELRELGIQISAQDIELLLDTVTGDDQVSLATVFHNIKRIAGELERITRESGESPEAARRYYGTYLVLLEVLDLAQRAMIRSIQEEYVPELKELGRQAEANIRAAERLIRKGEGEEATLRQNIASNRMTERVILLYQDHLREHETAMARANEDLQQLLRTAENTYQTVKLSAQLSELIRSASRDLQAITSLRVPPLRAFTNEAMREEWRRLSETLVRP